MRGSNYNALMLTLTLAAFLAAQVPPEKANATFTVSDPELSWSLWASEPLFVNPTCMDIDHKGRVWVCESVNYRCTLHGKPLNRPEGDRILILEDTKGTGKADKVTVFYQAPDIHAPLGIAVAKDPDRAAATRSTSASRPTSSSSRTRTATARPTARRRSCSPAFGGIDHDHGVHGILDRARRQALFLRRRQGVKDLQSSDGKGRKWTTQQHRLPGRHHLALRPRRQEPRTDRPQLPQRVRAVRRQLRHHLRLRQRRRRQPADAHLLRHARRQLRLPPRGRGESHWHEEQPGVVPKILRTCFGSPTGMCVYEGTLLPKKYQGQLLHTDAGPRQLRCYHLKPQGAGYDVEREDMVNSTRQLVPPVATSASPRTAASSSPTGTTPASAATAWAI